MLLLAVFPLACSVPGSVAPERLVVAGSSTIRPVVEVAAERFESRRPGARIDVQEGGSSVGLSAPLSGIADIGMVSRDLRPEEAARLRPVLLARDGIALIVHRDNPLGSITTGQVVGVYTGAVRNWRELGGPDAAIVAINKEEGRGTLDLFQEHFGIRGRFRPDIVIIGPNGQAIATVAGNRDAIAYVSIGSATAAAAAGAPVKALSLDGVPATEGEVASGRYPLVRDLNLVTAGEPVGLAREFLDFLVGSEGQAIVAEHQFVPRTHRAEGMEAAR